MTEADNTKRLEKKERLAMKRRLLALSATISDQFDHDDFARLAKALSN